MIEDDRILSCKNVYNAIQKRFGFNQDYVKLQYIVANGTQYIDTGYVPNSETKIEAKFKVDQIFDDVSINYQPLYGASATYNSRAFEFWPQAYGFSCYDGNKYKDHTGVLLNQDNTVVQDRNVLNVNGTISTFSYQSFTSPSTLCIFATNRTSQGIVVYNYNNSNCYLYYLKISDNNELIHDFIPAKRKSDDSVGLFDLVTNTFYENSGTGTFIDGPEIILVDDVPDMPANIKYTVDLLENFIYDELEYIESDGTQWIDTNVIPNKNTIIQIKMMALEGTGDVLVGFMTNDNDDSKDFRLFNHGTGNSGIWYWDIGSSRLSGSSWSKNSIYNLEAGNNYVKNLDTGQNILTGDKVDTFNTTYTIRLLRGNDSAWFFPKDRIYSLKIFENDMLIRDYIPVKNLMNNKIGLYDKENHKFYESLGTGNFISGPKIENNKVTFLPEYSSFETEKKIVSSSNFKHILKLIPDQR